MIDIVYFDGEKFELGFSKVHHFRDFNIVVGGTDKANREAVENKKVDILLSPEKGRKNDFLHSRNSGLNHVLCKLAKENDVAVGFNFNDILNAKDSKERSKLIGRMQQNVRFCRKFKTKMVLASFAKNKYEMRNAKDLLAFAQVLGMTPAEAKKALSFKIEQKEDIKVVE